MGVRITDSDGDAVTLRADFGPPWAARIATLEDRDGNWCLFLDAGGLRALIAEAQKILKRVDDIEPENSIRTVG